ncbi:hypothetical protein T484DRAFT_1764137, partial [Baffinella frigidus]
MVHIARTPPVLLLHLKRFRYEVSDNRTHKLQKPLTFPPALKLQPSYLAASHAASGDAGLPDPAASCAATYTLNAIISHHGHTVT